MSQREQDKMATTNYKFLDILIEELGIETIIDYCNKKRPAPPAASVPVTPEQPSQPVTKPPPVIKRGEKVIVKKIKKADPVVKNLEPELEKEEVKPEVKAEVNNSDDWICGACSLGPGNDHRMCICNHFDYNVAKWENARVFGHSKPQVKPELKPVEVKKPEVKPEVKPVEAKKPEVQEEAKKVGRPKKALKELPRCDARIYGDKIEMEGTKAPNGGTLHCFKRAQCERKGSECIALNDSTGEMRHLAEGEDATDDESKFHVCKVCVKRWEARQEKPSDWHGFFDDNGAPETSHFEGGAWYKKKMASVSAKKE